MKYKSVSCEMNATQLSFLLCAVGDAVEHGWY